MTRIEYPQRLLADKGFVLWLIEKDKLAFFKLTHIKASSKFQKRKHNVMVEEDIQEILKEKKIKEETIRRAFKGIPLPNEISRMVKDKPSQMVLFAMVLSNEEPFDTALLTNKTDIKGYKKSKHYEGVKSVTLIEEEESLKTINLFYRRFKLEKGRE